MTEIEIQQLRKDVDWIMSALTPQGLPVLGPPVQVPDIGVLARLQELEETVETLQSRVQQLQDRLGTKPK